MILTIGSEAMIGAGGAVADHLSWSPLQWAVMVVLAMITAGMVAAGVFTMHGGQDWAATDERLGRWVGGFGVVAGLFGQAPVLWVMVRHASGLLWPVVVCFGVASMTAAAVYYAAALAEVPVSGRMPAGRPVWFRWVPAVGAGVVAAGVLIGDGADRAATAVLPVVGFVVLLVAGVVWLAVSVSPSRIHE